MRSPSSASAPIRSRRRSACSTALRGITWVLAGNHADDLRLQHRLSGRDQPPGLRPAAVLPPRHRADAGRRAHRHQDADRPARAGGRRRRPRRGARRHLGQAACAPRRCCSAPSAPGSAASSMSASSAAPRATPALGLEFQVYAALMIGGYSILRGGVGNPIGGALGLLAVAGRRQHPRSAGDQPVLRQHHRRAAAARRRPARPPARRRRLRIDDTARQPTVKITDIKIKSFRTHADRWDVGHARADARRPS